MLDSCNVSEDESVSCEHLNNFTEVMQNLIKSRFLKKCTHIDLSGIQAIDHTQLLDLLSDLSEYGLCGNLLSVHLNDLGVNHDPHLVEEIIDTFQVQRKHELKY